MGEQNMAKASAAVLLAFAAACQAASPSHVFIDEDMIGMPEIKGKGIFDLLEWPEDKEAEPSFLQVGDDPQKVSPKKLECNCRFVRQAAPVHPDVVAAAKQTVVIQDRGVSFKETNVEVHNVPHREEERDDREEERDERDYDDRREMRFQEERDDDREPMRIEDDRDDRDDRRMDDDRDYDSRDDRRYDN